MVVLKVIKLKSYLNLNFSHMERTMKILKNKKELMLNIKSKKMYLFDFDGTLAETETLQWKAYNMCLEEYNIVLSNKNIKRYIGNQETKIYKMMQRRNKMKSRGSYKKLKDIAVDNGGKMEWNPDTKHWEITINNVPLTYTSNGSGYIRELDALYVPLVVEPRHYSDHTDTLLQDAEKIFLARFGL